MVKRDVLHIDILGVMNETSTGGLNELNDQSLFRCLPSMVMRKIGSAARFGYMLRMKDTFRRFQAKPL